MSPVSRGFRHLHRAPAGQESRLPPGQYVTDGFSVLSAGPTPHTSLDQWTFSITQGGQAKKSWTWQEFRVLSAETVTADIHCVTRWSKLGTVWRGVSVDTLLGQAGRDAPYVMALSDGGYRHRTGSDVAARLLYSSRTLPDVIYRAELGEEHNRVQVSYTLTRSQPPGWTGYTGRINQALLAEVAWPAEARPLTYIRGPTSFVETAAAALVELGYPAERVRTERFGATGGR